MKMITPNIQTIKKGENKMSTRKLIIAALLILMANMPGKAQLVWNHACRFEGNSSSYIAVPNQSVYNKYMNKYMFTPPSLLVIIMPITAECWIYPDNATLPKKQIILQKAAGTSPTGFALYLNNGRPSVKVNNVHILSAVTQVPSEKWTHLAVVQDKTGYWSIYMNGLLINQVYYNHDKKDNTDSLYIGKGSESPFKGYMDEIRIWAKALSTDQILKSYRTSLATYSGFKSTGNPPSDLAANGYYSNLLLSLTFQDDETYGSIFSLSDWSGCGFNAKNNGVTALDLSNRPSTTIFQNESFAGIDSFACLAGADNLYNSPTNQITLEAWFWYDHGDVGQYLIKKGTDYRLYIDPTLTSLVLRADINGQNLAAHPFPKLGIWRHAAFTYNSQNGEFRLYYNGEIVQSGTQQLGAINNSTDSLRIGHRLIGYEDEVRISDYVKSPEEIRAYMFQSIDRTNHPNPSAKCLNYSLDGYAVDNMGIGGSRLYFRGNSRFSNPSTVDNVPVSPINRNDNTGFSQEWIMSRYMTERIPANGFGGTITNELQVSSGVTISDANLFVGLNHTNEQDLNIYLISPYNDTIDVYAGQNQLGTNDNIITIFDDDADSSLQVNRYTSFGPLVIPQKKINEALTGKSSAGKWTLLIKDIGNAADIGYLYSWGLQFVSAGNGGDFVEPNNNNTALRFNLMQNYPNPFNPATSINFTIARGGEVKLVVYDILGREAAVLANGQFQAGKYEVVFDGSKLASGVYFYKLEASGFTDIKKMMLVK
jgi:subtilisin-like proprotein convertase family protein